MATQKQYFSEVGLTGLTRYGNHIYEEFLPQLRWPRAGKIYEEMSGNDPTIGAVLFAAEQMLRRVTWRVQRASDSQADRAAATFLEECMKDLDTTWADLITEILTMLTHGWSWHEIVFKYRRGPNRDPSKNSQYNDGRIGWAKIAGRAQTSLDEWRFDDKNNVVAMVQVASPNFQRAVIPLEKSLLFRTKVVRNNPEGRSVLRNAYRPWFFKKRIEEIEGIGIERDLAGLPVLTPPEGINIWDTGDPEMVQLKAQAEKLVSNVRRDENEGIVKPFGWDLTLLSTGSRRQFDTNAILNRYDQRIAITILADMVLLGADKVGSFALAEVKKSLFAGSLEAWADSICEVFNRKAIPQLFQLNAFPGITELPKLIHGEIETPSLKELGDYIEKIANLGFDLVTDEVEAYLREVASLPQKGKDEEEAGQDVVEGGEEDGGNEAGSESGSGPDVRTDSEDP